MSQEGPKRASASLRGLLGLYNGNRNSLPPVDEVKEEPGSQANPIDVDQDDIDTQPDNRESFHDSEAEESERDGDEDDLDDVPDGKDSKEDKKDEGDFRIAAKHILITYARSGDHVAEDLEQHVRCICKEKGWDINKLVATTEKHSDGSNHVHIGIKFVNKPNLTRANTFDLPCDCGCGESMECEHCCKCATIVELDAFEWLQFLESGLTGIWH